MSLDNKIALLKKYVPQDYFKVGSFVDACDTTDAFCFAKIMQINPAQGNLQVNFDGWSNKWDLVSGVSFLITDYSGTDLNRARLLHSGASTQDTQDRRRQHCATTSSGTSRNCSS